MKIEDVANDETSQEPVTTHADVASAIPYAAFLHWITGWHEPDKIRPEGLDTNTIEGAQIYLDNFNALILHPAQTVVSFAIKTKQKFLSGENFDDPDGEYPPIDKNSTPWLQYLQDWLDWTNDDDNIAFLALAFDELDGDTFDCGTPFWKEIFQQEHGSDISLENAA